MSFTLVKDPSSTVQVGEQHGDVAKCHDGFEGPEKLMEIWFVAKDDSSSLRKIQQRVWQEMLDLVNCQILSSISNDFADAYLLSESSFFVFPRKLVLKTCGSTTLLNALPKILQLAQEQGMIEVEDFFYSRQNFFFPDKQLHPHKDFKDEVIYLDQVFVNGSAFVLGRVNGNHYNFYNAESRDCKPDLPDITFEVMMTGLDNDIMKSNFYADTFCKDKTAKEVGVHDLLPGALIDDFIFEPCGYSVNGLLEDAYFTIHVTPEEEHSYASFETNAVLDDYQALLMRVLKVFQPTRFMLVMTENKHIVQKHDYKMVDETFGKAENAYLVEDHAVYNFQHYQLSYFYFKAYDFYQLQNTLKNRQPKLLF